MPETPWPPFLLEAVLHWRDDSDIGDLTFIDPDGNKAHIQVSRGQQESNEHGNIWHIEEFEDRYVVSPSVHFIDHFHSPNPVTFARVDHFS